MKSTKILLASTFLVLVSACSGSCSCGTTDSEDGNGGSGGSSSTTGSTAGSGGAGGEGDGGSTTAATGGGSGTGGENAGGAGGGGTTAGYCALGCTEAVDCCAAGAQDCPSDVYPNNWTCDEGLCVFGGCATNEECTFGGALPDYECFPSDAGGLCLEACDVDADCTAPLTCIGELDGRTYCSTEPVDPEPCVDDADCNGFGVCQEDGTCSCAADGECTAEGYVCVE